MALQINPAFKAAVSLPMYPFMLPLRDLVKSADTLPNRPKFWMLFFLALVLLGCVGLYQLPAILHEAPPTIRALREQPVQQPVPPHPDQVAGVK